MRGARSIAIVAIIAVADFGAETHEVGNSAAAERDVAHELGVDTALRHKVDD